MRLEIAEGFSHQVMDAGCPWNGSSGSGSSGFGFLVPLEKSFLSVPARIGSVSTTPDLGVRLRGRTATQRSKKGSEKVLGMVLGKGSQKGSEKGACYGFYNKIGF